MGVKESVERIKVLTGLSLLMLSGGGLGVGQYLREHKKELSKKVV